MILFMCAADQCWRGRQLAAPQSRRCVAPCVVTCPPVSPWCHPLDGERVLSDEFVPGRAVLRECGPFSEGRRGGRVLEVLAIDCG